MSDKACPACGADLRDGSEFWLQCSSTIHGDGFHQSTECKLIVAERDLTECRRACERFAMQVATLAAERDAARWSLATLEEIMKTVYAERDAAIALLWKARLHVGLTSVADEIDRYFEGERTCAPST